MNRNSNNRNRRNGNGRIAVRTSPKAAAARPTRVFSRTLRQTQVLTFSSTSGGVYATLNATVKADPRNFVDWELAASPFEMFRVKRLRAFVLPASVPSASFQTQLANIASTTIWTAPDYTSDEISVGSNIKSYQNARFHSMSLNGLKKLVDTDVRLNSVQGGVLPTSTWLPCQASTNAGGWNPTQINYTGFQLYAENPAIYNVTPSLQASLSLVYEVDVEFKQPGFTTPPTSLALPGQVTINTNDQESHEVPAPLPRSNDAAIQIN